MSVFLNIVYKCHQNSSKISNKYICHLSLMIKKYLHIKKDGL